MKTILKEDIYNESALKHLFGRDILKKISQSIIAVYPSFDKVQFLGLFSKLESLEMKARVHLLRDELKKLLPTDCATAFKILLKSVHHGQLNGFDLWPYTEFVQTYGLDKPDLSLKVLKKLTVLFTSEWAVRPFLKLHPEETLKFLLNCTIDKNMNIRRWASEGTRPRLPWGERLQEFILHPEKTLSILDALKFDSELFVRKSVANHLNDITKDHPDFVINVLTRWKKEAESEHSLNIDWIIKHSLRTLIKEGHTGALKLIGVSKAKIKLNRFKIKEKEISIGDRLNFEIEIQSTSNKDQKLVIDYIVHFVTANKKITLKVFKLKNSIIPARGIIKIETNHHFKKITTRNYYSGVHSIEIQINGDVIDKKDWLLKDKYTE